MYIYIAPRVSNRPLWLRPLPLPTPYISSNPPPSKHQPSIFSMFWMFPMFPMFEYFECFQCSIHSNLPPSYFQTPTLKFQISPGVFRFWSPQCYWGQFQLWRHAESLSDATLKSPGFKVYTKVYTGPRVSGFQGFRVHPTQEETGAAIGATTKCRLRRKMTGSAAADIILTSTIHTILWLNHTYIHNST